jgi:glycine/D-amino acid oxidase-like deaminating enzyme
MVDLLIVGGGIIGCSAAAFAAERGARVLLVEATEIGAGASGRNSGAVQHPFDPVLAKLHAGTLRHYRALGDADLDFRFPATPAGLLLLTDEPAEAADRAAQLAAVHPELAPETLGREALRTAEPILAEGLWAVRLATGYPTPPHAATAAMARRAVTAGAKVRTGTAAGELTRADARVTGVRLADGSRLVADAVLVAAGPWSPHLVDPSGAWRPIRPTYGVTVSLALATPARHVLEEGVVHTINRPVAGAPGADIASSFSLVSVGQTSTLGSTFLPSAPDEALVAPLLIERGARLVPDVGRAGLRAVRTCARPQSDDGRPFIGAVPGSAGLFICAGHGPWGISTGPGSAEMVVEAILDGTDPIPPELRVDRSAEPETVQP